MVRPPARRKLIIVDGGVHQYRIMPVQIHLGIASSGRNQELGFGTERSPHDARHDPHRSVVILAVVSAVRLEEQQHPVRRHHCRRCVLRSQLGRVKVPERNAVGRKLGQKVVCKSLGCFEEFGLCCPFIALRKSGNSSGLAARPAAFVRVALVRHPLLDAPVRLLEIDDMACAIVGPDVGLQRLVRVSGCDFC
jgi:hypothetical protein